MPLIIAEAIIVAAERMGSFMGVPSISARSISIDTVDASDIVINVRSPAECLLLDLSHPIIAERTSEIAILKITDHVPSCDDQSPRSFAILS